jgi:RimJ/RimL family protein N-acetyltransferase
MIFETKRLIARRFDPRDLEAFVTMRADREVARFQSWDDFSEEEGHKFLQEMSRMNPGNPGWFQFALQDKDDGAFAGDCGLKIVETDNRLAQIGYTIVRSRWKNGLATEVVNALLKYAFSSFSIHRIAASVDPLNLASCRVLEKAGMRREALFRESEWFKGAWADDAVYAMLRSDWQARKA